MKQFINHLIKYPINRKESSIFDGSRIPEKKSSERTLQPAMCIGKRPASRAILAGPAAIVVLSAFIVACDSNDDQDSDANMTIADPAVSGPAPTMPAPGSSPDDLIRLDGLDGSWVQNCLAIDSQETPYISSSLSVSLDSATLTVNNFSDSACSDMTSTSTAELSLLFSAETVTSSLGEATHVEITNEQTNAVRFDLMLIINDSLYFGDLSNGLDGSTIELRPQQLDQIGFYVRAVQ
ncbi:MAG: hypothetical protein KTR32_10605 [Granulosicoccus sp.]|nr:hypothetical protein [Granulosicoccus sp.]